MGQGQFRGGVIKGRSEPMEAVITVYPDHLEAQTLAGELHTLRYADMELETSAPGAGGLVCRDNAQGIAIVCHDPGFMHTLTKRAGRSLRKRLAPNPTRAVRQQVTRAVLVTVVIIAAIVLSWGMPKWVRFGLRSVARVTPLDVDARLGRAWLKRLDLGGRVLADNPWQAGLDDLVARLAPTHNVFNEFTAIVIEAPELDARALPGGPLIFNTAMLRRMPNPDALAALVAHEISHVTRRHLMQRLSQTLGVTTSVQFFFGDIEAVMRTPPSQLQIDVLLRPEDETEADHVALTLLHDAHLEPQGLIDLVSSLAADAQKGVAVPWLQRGPPPKKRLADLRARLRRLPTAPGSPRPTSPTSAP